MVPASPSDLQLTDSSLTSVDSIYWLERTYNGIFDQTKLRFALGRRCNMDRFATAQSLSNILSNIDVLWGAERQCLWLTLRAYAAGFPLCPAAY